MTRAGSTPILALEMYEHAYGIGYAAKAAGYLAALIGAVNWSSADSRFGGAIAGFER